MSPIVALPFRVGGVAGSVKLNSPRISDAIGCHPERQRQLASLFPGQPADDQAGHDPADCAQDPHRGELLVGPGHLAKRDGVHERQSRHVQDHVHEDEREERAERRRRRGGEEQHSTDKVQDAQDLLGGEELVRDEPNDERRSDRAKGIGSDRPN
jgi:hypothetical protein